VTRKHRRIAVCRFKSGRARKVSRANSVEAGRPVNMEVGGETRSVGRHDLGRGVTGSERPPFPKQGERQSPPSWCRQEARKGHVCAKN